jgi:putative ABC transport system permease protein
LTGLVTLRRKDFGRRRALGAPRSLIILLVLTQTAGLALTGVIIGSGVATVVLFAGGDPLPGIAFTGAIAVLAMAVSLGAALVPAIIASRRDPITELRVP